MGQPRSGAINPAVRAVRLATGALLSPPIPSRSRPVLGGFNSGANDITGAQLKAPELMTFAVGVGCSIAVGYWAIAGLRQANNAVPGGAYASGAPGSAD